MAQGFEAGEHPRHVFQVAGAVVFAQQADQRLLQHLPPLTQQLGEILRRALGQRFLGQRRDHQQLRGEQAGFREQAFAAHAAQVV